MTSSAFYNYHREPSHSSVRPYRSPGSSTSSSMESESPPAGYFSTFSIVDPKSGGGDGGGSSSGSRSQKRNRRVFVCIPCHKRKLKCDKGQPCGRCVAYGAAEDCVYQPLPSSSSSPSASAAAAAASVPDPLPEPAASSRASSQAGSRDRFRYHYRHSDGRCRATGTSHWAAVCAEFEEACPYLFGSDPQWEPRYRQIKNLKYVFPSLAGANFPFSNSSPYAASKHDILNSLPGRGIADALLRNYMATFEVTHRLLHSAQFQQELEEFWADRESVLDGWLAQLCAMMALGCHSASDDLFNGTGQTAAQWTDMLLDGAQISFCRSPYMLMPNLTTIRTLCMMVGCKTVGLRGTGSSQVASLMAFVVRLAMSLQLHRSPGLFSGMSEFEAEMRRRIWATVQLLDLDVAIWAGTTPARREGDAEAPLNINDSEIRPDPTAVGLGASTGPHGIGAASGGWTVDNVWATNDYTDGAFQNKLAELLPLLAEVITAANSPAMAAPSRSGGGSSITSSSNNTSTSSVQVILTDYDRVMRLDKRIRLRLREAEVVLGSGRAVVRPEGLATLAIQHQFLRVLVHRALLALHHALARGPHPIHHEQSLRLSLESSMALVNIQQHLAAEGPMAVAALPVVASGNTLVLPSITVGGSSGPGSAASSPGLPPTLLGSPRFGPGAGLPVAAGPPAAASRQWLLDLCHDDFSIAAVYVLLGLRRGDFDECAQHDGVPSAELAGAALRQALGVARSRACRSLLQFKEFTGLSVLVGCLRSIKQEGGVGAAGVGCNRNAMLAALMEVAHDVEDVILTGKSDMIWSSASAAAGGAMGMIQEIAPPHHHQHLQPHSHHPHHSLQPPQGQPHGSGVPGAIEGFDDMMGVDFLGSFP